MLQRSGAAANGAASSNRSSQPSGLPWLKAEHLSAEKRTLTILMARAEKDRWSNNSVLLQVRYDGKLFLWQPNEKNPNFDLLIDIFGGDESKWAGQECLISIEEDKLTRKYFPRVSSIEEREAVGSRRRKPRGN